MSKSRTENAGNESESRKQSAARRRRDRAGMVEKAIESIEDRLESSDVKATFGDFIRLLQLQKELQAEQPREIEVTWIEPNDPESASEE